MKNGRSPQQTILCHTLHLPRKASKKNKTVIFTLVDLNNTRVNGAQLLKNCVLEVTDFGCGKVCEISNAFEVIKAGEIFFLSCLVSPEKKSSALNY